MEPATLAAAASVLPPSGRCGLYQVYSRSVTIGPGEGAIAPYNQDRLLLVVGLADVPVIGTIHIGPTAVGAAAARFPLPTDSPWEIPYSLYGPAVGFEWRASSPLGPNTLSVLEVCYGKPLLPQAATDCSDSPNGG